MFKSINNFTANVVKRQHTHNICARKDVKKLKKPKKPPAPLRASGLIFNFQFSIVNCQFLIDVNRRSLGKGDAVGPVEGPRLFF